jgi:hypothetical protein
MTLSNARSNTRRPVQNDNGINIALRSHITVSRYHTAIAETRSAIDDYALLLETIDNLAHALASVLGGMFGQPFLEFKI